MSLFINLFRFITARRIVRFCDTDRRTPVNYSAFFHLRGYKRAVSFSKSNARPLVNHLSRFVASPTTTMALLLSLFFSTASANSLPVIMPYDVNWTISATDKVVFNASGSYDNDGSIVSFRWSQISGPQVSIEGADTAVAQFSLPSDISDGSQVVLLLEVTDNEGAMESETFTVTVRTYDNDNSRNQPSPPADGDNLIPVILPSGVDWTVSSTDRVVLDASGSHDRDGSIVSYQWLQTGGPQVTIEGADTAVAQFSLPSGIGDGSQVVLVLEVTDNEGATKSETFTVTVRTYDNDNSRNQPSPPADRDNLIPVILPAGVDWTVSSTDKVVLDASGSHDRDGSIVSYQWSQTGGPQVTIEGADTAVAQFSLPSDISDGSQVVLLLEVTDDEGATKSETFTVTVRTDNDASPPAVETNLTPVISPYGVNWTVSSTDRVVFNASESYDRDGSIVSYRWSQTNGPQVSIEGADTAVAQFSLPPDISDGSQVVLVLEVTDNEGATKLGAFQVTVRVYDDANTDNNSDTSNVSPAVRLQSMQVDVQTRIVTQTGGLVTVTGLVVDEDQDQLKPHSFDWSFTNNALIDTDSDQSNSMFVFDPSTLTPGFYTLRLRVTDSASAYATADLLVQVVQSAPQLAPDQDSDGDGLLDNLPQEGFGDNDNDGIPNYLDAVVDPSLLHSVDNEQNAYLLQVTQGMQLSLGATAMIVGQRSAVISENDLVEYGGNSGGVAVSHDDGYEYPSGLYDFVVFNLPKGAVTVDVVLPLDGVLPDGAIYRKYIDSLGWQDFIVNDLNRIASAPGEPGRCPPPGDAAYVTGLSAGDYCVQLTIEDGGPNDADREINRAVKDPGGIAVVSAAPETSENPGQPSSDSTKNQDANSGSTGGGGLVGWEILFMFIIGVIILPMRSKNPWFTFGCCRIVTSDSKQ